MGRDMSSKTFETMLLGYVHERDVRPPAQFSDPRRDRRLAFRARGAEPLVQIGRDPQIVANRSPKVIARRPRDAELLVERGVRARALLQILESDGDLGRVGFGR